MSRGRTRGQPCCRKAGCLKRASLETGDFCLGSHLDGVLVERKSPSDMASCVGSNRERFERELKRRRYCRLIVVVEGSLSDVVVAGRKLHANSIMGTLAAWTVRYAPFVFCGSQRLAVDFAVRLLASQLPSEERRRLSCPASAPQTAWRVLKAQPGD